MPELVDELAAVGLVEVEDGVVRPGIRLRSRRSRRRELPC
jgi:hypothetical protein